MAAAEDDRRVAKEDMNETNSPVAANIAASLSYQ